MTRVGQRDKGSDYFKKDRSVDLVVHAFNSSTQESEAADPFEFESSLVYIRVPEQPGLHRVTLSWKTKK